jgi:hypothetical protein
VKLLAAAATTGAVTVMGLVVLPLGFFVSGATTPTAAGQAKACTGSTVTAQELDVEQRANASVIISLGKTMQVPQRGIVIALMTALQESYLRNLHYGDRDSVGLFQQRPSAGWGTVSELTDPPTAARKFYAALLKVPGWQQMQTTDAAQAVQISAFPKAYAKWEALATQILTGATPAPCPSEPAQSYANGRIPLSALQPLKARPDKYLRPDAATVFDLLGESYRRAFGTPICITDAYRTYAEQVAAKASKDDMAATPGTSRHGLGLAVDLCGGIEADGTPQHLWMLANAPGYGWQSPPWARPGGAGPHEPWHWEYSPSTATANN